MYLCELVSFNACGKCISSNIPILDMLNKSNLEAIENLRDIIKKSYEIKVMLSRQEENELNIINNIFNDDNSNSNNTCNNISHNDGNEKPVKYITMSQMFGHYMSHNISSCHLEVDYGYALTIHKSQGTTYDDVYIEYNNILKNMKEDERNKLLYTAITRSANRLHIYY